MNAVGATHVEGGVGRLRLDRQRVLHLRDRLAGEGRLVDDGAAAEEEAVGGDDGSVGARLAAERDDVARQQRGRRHGGPPARPEHLELSGACRHPAERLHVPLAGEGGGGLEDQNHPERHQRVLPVLVQQPERGAEELEARDRRRELLRVQLAECGQRNLE